MPASVEAIRAVGSEHENDWKLEPLTHAGLLPPEAGALKRILTRPEIAAIMERFSTADRAAIRAQKNYLTWTKLAFMCRFLSIACGTAALLDIAEILPEGIASLGLGLQYTFIAGALIIGLVLGFRQPFEVWMGKRAAAENERLDLFNKVTSTEEPPQTGELPVLPLQLEYFRRYLLDEQRRYYRGRGDEHARAAGKTKRWQWTAVGLTALAIIPASLGFLGLFPDLQVPQPIRNFAISADSKEGHVLMLTLGIIASALGDLTASLSLANLDRRNAARYLSNAANLDFLAEKYLGEARDAAAAGDRQRTQDFIDLVQSIISSEHREWTMLRDLAKDLNLANFAKMRVPGLKRKQAQTAATPSA
jgi:hypothetical protein